MPEEEPTEQSTSTRMGPPGIQISPPGIRKRRGGRVDALNYIASDVQHLDEERLDSVRRTVCQVVWMHLMGWKASVEGKLAFRRIFGLDPFEWKLTDGEINLAYDNSHDLYELSIEAKIRQYVGSLSPEKTFSIISGHPLQQELGKILRVHLTDYQTLALQNSVAEDRPDNMEVPDEFESLTDFLSELSGDLAESRHALLTMVQVVRAFAQSIQRTAETKHLTSEELAILKANVRSLDLPYLTAVQMLRADDSGSVQLPLETQSLIW
ncbi:hypothetical protein JDV02_009507, partial [Purpureocillium takamizusanense]